MSEKIYIDIGVHGKEGGGFLWEELDGYPSSEAAKFFFDYHPKNPSDGLYETIKEQLTEDEVFKTFVRLNGEGNGYTIFRIAATHEYELIEDMVHNYTRGEEHYLLLNTGTIKLLPCPQCKEEKK